MICYENLIFIEFKIKKAGYIKTQLSEFSGDRQGQSTPKVE
jgi:hypothetical protein